MFVFCSMGIKKPITKQNVPLQFRRHIVILAVPPVTELDVVGPFQRQGWILRLRWWKKIWAAR